MDLEEYLKQLDIEYKGEFHDNKYIIKLDSPEEFVKLYNKLSSNEDLEEENSGVIKADNTSIYYKSLTYDVILNLEGDFENNNYNLEIIGDYEND